VLSYFGLSKVVWVWLSTVVGRELPYGVPLLFSIYIVCFFVVVFCCSSLVFVGVLVDFIVC
jgi:hypothetical protein